MYYVLLILLKRSMLYEVTMTFSSKDDIDSDDEDRRFKVVMMKTLCKPECVLHCRIGDILV